VKAQVGDSTPETRIAREKPTSIVDVRSVSKRFGDVEALVDVSLQVEKGETVCIIGPSGSGKSTLLRCINHLEGQDSGEIYVNGHMIGWRRTGAGLVADKDASIARQRQEVGMVFQRFNLFQHMTALENVMSGPRRVRRVSAGQAREAAQTLLARVGLADKADQYPITLSGGQQQRVAIARALAMKPAVMLFDEPTSALDPETIGEVLDVMRELARDGMTMLVATHELRFAREVSDRMVMMDHGRIVEVGPPGRFFSNECSPRTRAFISKLI